MNILEINKKIAEIEGLTFEVAEKPQGELIVKYIRVEDINENNGKPFYYDYSPATQWVHGGPLLEKYQVLVLPHLQPEVNGWYAAIGAYPHADGETYLEAAMLSVITMSESSETWIETTEDKELLETVVNKIGELFSSNKNLNAKN